MSTRGYRHPTASSPFFTAPAATEIYTLSLHDALPIFERNPSRVVEVPVLEELRVQARSVEQFDGSHLYTEFLDRKSTRLISSHSQISYAVFCLKKKRKHNCTNCAHDVTRGAKSRSIPR